MKIATFVIGAALVGLAASPALAQRQGVGENAPAINTRVHPAGTHPRGHAVPRARHDGQSAYHARAQANPSQANPPQDRDAAMRACSEQSRKYGETTWGTMQMQAQRSCMAEHGFPE